MNAYTLGQFPDALKYLKTEISCPHPLSGKSERGDLTLNPEAANALVPL